MAQVNAPIPRVKHDLIKEKGRGKNPLLLFTRLPISHCTSNYPRLMKVDSSRNPYVIPDVKGNDTLAIPFILIGVINVAGNGRLRSKWYDDSYGSKAMIG
ncbi:hypothetical protein Tco_1173192 [Tanacetum coccineum]